MQRELDDSVTVRPIEILGVNGIGHEGVSGEYNDLICQGRSLPWLQDVDSVNVWASWRPEYRDVVVLDAGNHVVQAYNLTLHSLADSTFYKELRSILLDAAR